MAAVDQALPEVEPLDHHFSFVPSHSVTAAAWATPDTREGGAVEALLFATVEMLAALVEARDSYLGEHAADVSRLSLQLAYAFGCDEQELRTIALAGRLHDLGKVAVPDAVLQKADLLTASEWDVMRTHATVGAEIVGRIPGLRPTADLIRAHHERWDGAGYPSNLAGDEIPLGARLLAVADAYYAITTSRPYQSARDHDVAVAEIARCSGSQFDPAVVRALQDLPVTRLLR